MSLPAKKYTANDMTVEERAEKALAMRRAGKSYAEIGKELKTNPGMVHRMVKAQLREVIDTMKEEAEEVLEMELSRIDAMMAAIYPKALQGHLLSVDRVLRLMERRAAFLGIDAPKRQEITGGNGGPIEVDERVLLIQENRDQRIQRIYEEALARNNDREREIPHLALVQGGTDLASSGGTTDESMAESG